MDFDADREARRRAAPFATVAGVRAGTRGRAWWWALGALVAVRVAVPLAALVASGSALPGLPRFGYAGLTGDATGFYAATREFIASWARLPVPVLLALAAAAVGSAALIVWAWVSRKAPRAWLIVAAAAVPALVASAAVTQMEPPGAAVFGWPLVWSLPMLPYRALGAPLDPDIAFGFGLVLSLAANAATVVATAYAGLHATGRRGIGLGAAAAFALWPLAIGSIAGERGWENGTWAVDAGLAMYTEPVSTALVTTALALLLSPHLDDVRVALAGAALGLATAVKLSNGLLAAVALALLVARLGSRRTAPFVGALLPFAVLVSVYWPKGYAREELLPDDPFALRYAADAWADSLLFGPRILIVLVPLAAVGAVALRPAWTRAMLLGWILLTALVYSFYRVTPQHPRFLFAVVPAVLILWALGAATVARAGAARLGPQPRRTYTDQSSASTRR